MTIRNRLTFIAAVTLAAGLGSATLATTANAFDTCSAYADSAVRQNQRNQQLGCGYTGIRWHNWREGHASWCRSVKWSVARAELQRRALKLNQCRFN